MIYGQQTTLQLLVYKFWK